MSNIFSFFYFKTKAIQHHPCKDRKKSYFLNRFYNNLSFIFAKENTNIIKSYISKYGEFRIRNPPNPIL
jgi:hypothetical protein